MAEADEPVAAEAVDVGIKIVQVFLETVQFTHRSDALSLPAETKPNVGNLKLQVELGLTSDEKRGYINLEARTDPSLSPVYNFEIGMVCLVALEEREGTPKLSLREFLDSPAAINIVYPFLREAVANVTQRGRFGPVWMNLVDPKAFGLSEKPSAPVETPKPTAP